VANGLTLTETAFWTRKLLGGFVILVVLFVVVKVGLNLREKQVVTRPKSPKVIEPTLAFGKLPALQFTQAANKRPNSYELKTVTGVIPQYPSIAKIFLMPKPAGVTFFSLEKGEEFAARLGFLGEPEELNASQYRWTQKVEIPEVENKKAQRSLVVDVASGNFQLNYDLSSDPVITAGTLPEEKVAVQKTITFLKELNLYADDLVDGHQVAYLNFQGGRLAEVLSRTEAKFIRISFFRKGIKNALLGTEVVGGEITPIAPPKFDQAQVRVVFSPASEKERQFVRIDYIFWPVDYENFATYPLKSGEEAFNELVNNGGTVISGGDQNKATIRRVSLAYYDPQEHQDFFQPVFIFEGDNNFIAYVPAVANTWIEGGDLNSSQP
jgi:hypothetical protein